MGPDTDSVLTGERRALEWLGRLTGVALELGGAQSLADLMDMVIHHGVPVLGADGGAVLMVEPDGFRLALSDRLGEDVQVVYGFVPLDNPLPAPHVARTGESVVLGTRAAGLAFTPAMAQVYEDTRRSAWAFAPLRARDRLLGSLAVSWIEEREIDPQELSLIEAFAAQCAQALDRILANEAEQAARLRVRTMVESLQHSLLTRPAVAGVDLAVRYLPAVQEAKVGGDWYDAFPRAAGTTLVSVGDVAGHDGDAAAAMAQLRSLLRGLAIDGDDGPAALLSRLDRAIDRLELTALATAVVVELGPVGDAGGASGSWVRWSSAGHTPLMLRLPDGAVLVLERAEADLMLGVDPAVRRAEEWLHLPAGARLLLYTDGLVERREESLDVGLDRLQDALTTLAADDVEMLGDGLLAAALPEVPFDDVVLVVVSTGAPAGHGVPAATTVLPAVPSSVAAARRFVAATLAGAGLGDDLADVALLCTSELVSNAVLHTATSWVTLDAAVRDGVLQVGVRDASPGIPAVALPGEGDTGGRGLLLVEALTDRWGATPDGPGKRVWFELTGVPVLV